jgi:hypothetical protein
MEKCMPPIAEGIDIAKDVDMGKSTELRLLTHFAKHWISFSVHQVIPDKSHVPGKENVNGLP